MNVKGLLSKPLDHYQAIFFDAGDTLITLPEAERRFYEYLLCHQFSGSFEEVSLSLNKAMRRHYVEKKQDEPKACTPDSDRLFWMGLYEEVLMEVGLHEEWSRTEIDSRCDELYELFVSSEHYVLFDDVAECLQGLKTRGFSLGVISNFAPTLRGILEARGILHYFDWVLVSTEVGLEKPDPAIFSLALNMSGLEVNHVLYIGDHDINDIWAPAQIGMDAMKIKRYHYHQGEGLDSLKQLLYM